MAQDFRGLGQPISQVRKLYTSGSYIEKSESDTCDTFVLPDNVKFRIFYKNGICVKMENVMDYGYSDGFKTALNNADKRIGENAWIIQDGAIRVEMTAIKNQNKCIIDFTAVDKKR